MGSRESCSNYSCSGVLGANTCAVSAACTTAFNIIDKSAGTFSIPHPDPEKSRTHLLVHAFVESPTAGENLYRFEVEVVDGKGVGQLPSYFKHVNRDVQFKITPKDFHGMATASVDESWDSFTLTATADGTYNVLVMGTRTDKGGVNNFLGPEVLIPLQ
jgi:hypothetical protein